MDFDFSKNHFELFGLAPGFNLDLPRLEAAYRELQTQIHPDRFAHQGEQERRMAMQWATHVNEACQTLKKPLPRARYLLALRGIDTEEERNTAMPVDFLMAQMEWREAVQTASDGEDVDGLQTLHDRCRKETRQLQDELAKSLDETADYTEAAGLVRKLRFMEKLGEEVDLALERLEA